MIVHLIVIVMMMPLMVLIIRVGARRGTETSSDPEYTLGRLGPPACGWGISADNVNPWRKVWEKLTKQSETQI